MHREKRLFVFTFATPAFTNAVAPKIENLCLNQSKKINERFFRATAGLSRCLFV